ncbi:MAG: hypothetical protein Q4A55_01600 [Aerococcus sp.]|nr:hypothetical protein [Aerococcus sp.]
MADAIRLPELGEGLFEAEVVNILVKPGGCDRERSCCFRDADG